jgi:putative ABC transport system permease protein
MSTIAPERAPAAISESWRPPNGGAPARRAVTRWGVRLLRREWRQQLLVIGLLIVAVAATTIGLAVATNASPVPSTTWVLPGHDARLGDDVAAVQGAFGPATVYAHDKVSVPGSVTSIDLRAIEPDARGSADDLRLVAGRLPSTAGEAALTSNVAGRFGVHVGDTWRDLGRDLQVVGIVEDQTTLGDQFVLVGGQLATVDNVTVRVDTDVSRGGLRSFHLPSGSPNQIIGESAVTKTESAVAVLALATLTLLFVGLVSIASYSVIAQRRQRALGMLASMGATDRHVRTVMLANGAAAGLVSAAVGVVLGLAGWLVYAPHLENSAGHRIDRFDLPWWALLAATALAVSTSTAAAWWPARAISRASIVTALSARPTGSNRAAPIAATGVVVLGLGVLLLAFGRPDHALLIITGTVATVVGVVLFGPLAIRATATMAPRLPISARLALRDLARYRTRSGAALGAATLAIGIASIITVSAASHIAQDSATGGNLPANEMMVYRSGDGPKGGPLGEVPASDLATISAQIDSMAARLGTRDVVQLDMAIDPDAPVLAGPGPSGRPPAGLADVRGVPGGGKSFLLEGPLYVATPDVLAQYGIDANKIDPATDVIASRKDLGGLQLVLTPRSDPITPQVQQFNLPHGTSEPQALLTESAVTRLGLEEVPAVWRIKTASPLTAAQIDSARRTAAAAGLSIETRDSQSSLVQLGHDATAGGVLFALVVLAMTVGLIRSEGANDLRILSATGAGSRTRRNLTAATAGTLALLAAVLGMAAAYLTLGAFYRSSLDTLAHPPTADLIAIGLGLPIIAAAAGWLLAGRQPAAIARRPLE